MKRKSITKNYIYNLIYQILIILLPLITTPYISRVLGAEGIGIYSYTLSISAYFILFGSLGMALYGQREIAYNQDNEKKYSITFWEIILLRIVTMTLSLAIFYFSFVRGEQYQVYYKILMLEIIGHCLDISWFFQGLEEFKKTVIRNIVVKLISITAIFLLVKTSKDLPIYFWIYVLSILVGNCSLWFYLPKYLKRVKLKEIHIFRHLRPTISLFIPQIAIQVYTILDRTMIGTIIENKSEVGFYEQSQKIVRMALTVITSLGTVMLPRIANYFANDNKQKIFDYMYKSFSVVFLLAFPMIFGLLAVSDTFVPIFFGQGYDRVSILIKVICPIILLIGLSNVIGNQYLLTTKRQKEYTISVISGAVINLIINSCLIWKYGAIGASVGTVIAELTVTLIQLYFVKREFKLINMIKLSKNYVVSSIIMFVVCIIVGKIIQNSILSVGSQVVIGILTYMVCLAVIKDKFILEIINKIRKKESI